METEKQNIQIEWELASSPKGRFWAKLLPTFAISFFLFSMIFIVCFIIFVISAVNQGLKDVLMSSIQVIESYSWFALIALFVLVVTIVFSFVKVFRTRFVLGDSGITIGINTTTKTYSWDKFDCFTDRADHLPSWPSGSLIPWLVKTIRLKMGKVNFYVQFKNPTRMNPYIILEAPSYLGNDIQRFLRQKISEI